MNIVVGDQEFEAVWGTIETRGAPNIRFRRIFGRIVAKQQVAGNLAPSPQPQRKEAISSPTVR